MASPPGPLPHAVAVVLPFGEATYFLLLFLLIAAGAFAFSWKKSRDWRLMGEALGLAHPSGATSVFGGARLMSGTFQGRKVAMWTFTRGTGKSKTTYTAARAEAPRSNPYVEVHGDPEGLFDKIAKAFGGQDVTTDDPPFDKAFRVRSTDEVAARQLLDPLTREALLASARRAEWHLRDARAETHVRGFVTDVEAGRQLLEVASRLAQAAERAFPAREAPADRVDPWGTMRRDG